MAVLNIAFNNCIFSNNLHAIIHNILHMSHPHTFYIYIVYIYTHILIIHNNLLLQVSMLNEYISRMVQAE